MELLYQSRNSLLQIYHSVRNRKPLIGLSHLGFSVLVTQHNFFTVLFCKNLRAERKKRCVVTRGRQKVKGEVLVWICPEADFEVICLGGNPGKYFWGSTQVRWRKKEALKKNVFFKQVSIRGNWSFILSEKSQEQYRTRALESFLPHGLGSWAM